MLEFLIKDLRINKYVLYLFVFEMLAQIKDIIKVSFIILSFGKHRFTNKWQSAFNLCLFEFTSHNISSIQSITQCFVQFERNFVCGNMVAKSTVLIDCLMNSWKSFRKIKLHSPWSFFKSKMNTFFLFINTSEERPAGHITANKKVSSPKKLSWI